MVHKPIFRPPPMIEFVGALAKQAIKNEKRNVPFTEVVRRTFQQYHPDFTDKDNVIVETMLNCIIDRTNETVIEVRKLNSKLDISNEKRARGYN